MGGGSRHTLENALECVDGSGEAVQSTHTLYNQVSEYLEVNLAGVLQCGDWIA